MKIKSNKTSSYTKRAYSTKETRLAPPTVNLDYDETVVTIKAPSSVSGNSAFIDSSSLNNSISKTGAVTQGPSTLHYTDGWAYHTQGTGYVTTPGTADLAFGTGDFTVECWILPNSIPEFLQIYTNRSAAAQLAGTFYLAMNDTSIRVGQMSTGGNVLIVNYAFTLGTWHHIAACRSGGVVQIYVNGVLLGSGADTANYSVTAQAFAIGSNWDKNGNALNGHISNLHVIKGLAKYTANFTPSRLLIAPVAQTVLLTARYQSYIDGSSAPKVLTPTGEVRCVRSFFPRENYNPAKHTGQISVWRIGSPSYLQIPDSADLELGASDFTIECWYYSDTGGISAAAIIAKRSATINTGFSPFLIYHDTNRLSFYSSSNNTSWNVASDIAFTTALPRGAWHHIAVTRQGSTFRGFLNGAQAFTFTSTAALLDHTGNITIGHYTNTILGSIADLRIVKGTAVYTSNFTPPTQKLETIAGTVLHLKGENYNIADNERFLAVENYLGAGAPSTSDVRHNGTSLAFNGTGAMIVGSPQTWGAALGTGDFTIEFWLKPTLATAPAQQAVCSSRNPANSNPANAFWIGYSLNTTTIGINDNTRVMESPLIINEWSHVAFVRASGRTCLYINGEAKVETTRVMNFTGTELVLGNSANLGFPLTGFLDDFRITQEARYVENFTPPSRSLPTQRGLPPTV